MAGLAATPWCPSASARRSVGRPETFWTGSIAARWWTSSPSDPGRSSTWPMRHWLRAPACCCWHCAEAVMRRILFSWRGINIYSYPAMLYVGLLAGLFVGTHVAQRAGMNADRFAVAVVILLIPALAGSRLYFVLSRWEV